MVQEISRNCRLTIILWIFIYCNWVESHPVDITGKDIKYYKLTPNEGSGSYNFDYGTQDGAQRSERGFVKHMPGRIEPLLVVTGSFKYPNASEVFYIADEQGYRIVSKQEIDDLHNQLPNEIFPTSAKPSNKDVKEDTSTPHPNLVIPAEKIQSPVPRVFSTITPFKEPISQSSHSVGVATFPPEESGATKTKSQTPSQIPVTESKLIKVNIIRPASNRVVTCAPGKCSGARESKIFKIKNLRYG